MCIYNLNNQGVFFMSDKKEIIKSLLTFSRYELKKRMIHREIFMTDPHFVWGLYNALTSADRIGYC